MRDPARLDGFYDRLKEAHKKVPDMRIGQFLMNILGEYFARYVKNVFYIEDEEFMSDIEEILNKWTGV